MTGKREDPRRIISVYWMVLDSRAYSPSAPSAARRRAPTHPTNDGLRPIVIPPYPRGGWTDRWEHGANNLRDFCSWAGEYRGGGGGGCQEILRQVWYHDIA